MNWVSPWVVPCVLAVAMSLAWGPGSVRAQGQRPAIPEVLQPWQDWVTWGETHPDCPTAFDNARDHFCFWPARLSLSVEPQEGSWTLDVTAFEATWVPLPGGGAIWPQEVVANEDPVVVVQRDDRPAVHLPAGRHTLAGRFVWNAIPERLPIPSQIGLLSLTIEVNSVPLPDWDAQGDVWLRRVRADGEDEEALSALVYRVLEDGIPLWLRTRVELTVSGRSREEELGSILPDGWTLSHVRSPIPVAVDDRGRMTAQVRAGKWVIEIDAFRTDDAREFQFADDASPIVNLELIGFRAQAEFRMAELEGMPSVEVSQTTFPSDWRDLPVYQWDTSTSFRLNEKMRGMGEQRPEGLNIARRLWLDSNGRAFTFQDQLQGNMQQIWRLDVAPRLELGAARMAGEPLLITANPNGGSAGVEIRTRMLNLTALGRGELTRDISATGWQADADALNVAFELPPGWRMLAVFGADEVDGDWLTAWTLLDLFLLLIVSLAVFRMWGVVPGMIAFLAVGLTYHEPGAARLTWLFLLVPIALSRVVTHGPFRRWIDIWKFSAIAVLALVLLPFVAYQIQSIIYPQLEAHGIPFTLRGPLGLGTRAYSYFDAGMETAAVPLAAPPSEAPMAGDADRAERFGYRFDSSNLLYDPQARIQTGPAEPSWTWNRVLCRWNGPVAAGQQLRPVLISMNQHRLLAVVRLVVLLMLTATLFGVRVRWPWRAGKPVTAGALLLACGMLPASAAAQIPDTEMLQTLRQRLLEPSEAYPHAADIASVQLTIAGQRITMQAQIHAALDVAVPLPGRLPDWSPVSVSIDGQPAEAVGRRDGYLWIALRQGVHQVNVEGLLPETPEWAWTFRLAPRRVSVDAPGWNVTGIDPNGVPETQIFFSRAAQQGDAQAAYDRRDFTVAARVERHLEIGLIWQARTRVSRLSASSKAISLQIPLLPGERVVTPNVAVTNNMVEVRMSAGQDEFTWESVLPRSGTIPLNATESDQWVETWHLVTSPIWNVSIDGLSPIYEAQQQQLIPVWRPWPGEQLTLTFTQPTAVSGETLTVRSVRHEAALGARQRATTLQVELECTVGSDFVITVDPEGEISSVHVNNQSIPVRREDSQMIVPVQPGRQAITAMWRTPVPLTTVASSGAVELPVAAANVTTVMVVPESRWVLWAAGPLRGPAVRFWTIIVFAVIAAWIVGGLKMSPLSRIEWVLLTIGLTQVPPPAALIVVAWLFALAWRGRHSFESTRYWRFNLLQLALVALTFASLAVLAVAIGEGLLGHPEMFIVGNNSTRTHLNWFQPRSGPELPEPQVVSVSVWFYRLLMLFWALWLAAALLRWLQWGWQQFSHDGHWRRRPAKMPAERVPR